GTPASPGIIIGRAYHVQRAKAEVVYQEIIGPGQVVSQLHYLEEAVVAVEEELKSIRALVEKELPSQVFFFEVHLMILRDPMFYHQARRQIEEDMVTASWAVVTVVKNIAQKFTLLDDSYLRSRMEDVESVAERVIRFLAGHENEDIGDIKEKGILIAHHLSPTDTTRLRQNRVMGFITEMGGRTSHTAIVAQALGIPAVVGLEKAMDRISSGSLIVLDATNGRVIVDPDEETLMEFQERQTRYETFIAGMRRKSHLPARTMDGHQLTVQSNIEQPSEAVSALDYGAEGIGLFRTEFLYLSQTKLPDEEQLYQAYREVVETMDGRPVTIRTLDLGGDKFAHHFDLVPEMNPAMGLRAVRLCLKRPDIFKTQLRAILRTSVHGPVRIMFPMISGVQEIISCRQILQECQDEIKSQGLDFDPHLKIGCMIEVPSAIFVADLLARQVDFFSIGTNDLIQYSLAVDRINEYVAYMYRPFHPAVLRMIQAVIKTGREIGIPVAMCGEMAADPGAVPLLLGLGLTEVSVNPQAVPRVKQVTRMADLSVCARLAQEALAFETEEQVAHFLNQELNRRLPETFGPDGLMVY
ncbi:MAG: phosphoenolpyruvate--protein phosphotransferase, partial [Deltaproteobacteria bacterium]|nr:phosphoenolpyruvate--protein phosphotransferase [Deltaproteobacteria bacterium]